MKSSTQDTTTKNVTKWFVCILSIFIFQQSNAANYYWVGGSGNWSDYGNHWATTSGGLVFHTLIPGLNDDVFFDSNSFTVGGNPAIFLDSTFNYCKNLNCTGVANAPVFNSNGATINVYGSLTLSSGMTVNCNFTMLAASGVQTVTTANCSIPLLSFNGTAIYSLTDNFNGSEIAMNDGTLNTNNHTLNIITRILTNGGTLNAGNTLINCTGYWQQSFSLIPLVLNTSNVRIVFNSNASWIFDFGGSLQLDSVTITGLSGSACFVNLQCNYFNCSKQINLSSGNPSAIPYQIHKAVFQDNVIFSKNCSVDSILFNNPGHSISIVDSLLINQEIIASSTCSQPIILTGGVISKSSGTVSLNYLTLSNSTATGGASFIAGNSTDLGNNNGWIINTAAPQNLFWVGGSGNWSDAAHWALTSGGAGGNCVPTLNDSAFFDANSFPSLVSNTVYVDIANVYCKNLNCTGVANAPVFNSNGATINVYGSLTLSSGMTVNCNFTMLAASGVQTVTTANCSIPLLSFNGTAIYSLTDNFNGSEIAMNDGTLNTNNHTLNIITRILTNGGTLNAGNTLINCTGYWQQSFSLIPLVLNTSNVRIVFNSSGTIFNFGGSLLTLQLDSVTIVTGLSNSACFVNLQCNYFNCSTPINLSSGNPTAVPYQIHKAVFQDNVIFSKNCSVDSILFNNPGHSISIVDSLLINQEIIASSTCSQPIILTGGVISKSSGTVSLNYLTLSNSTATGGASFIAGNSTDLGNNNGWIINTAAPQNLFWVGGSGNWSDAAHWALTSGGAGGNCVPTLNDSAFFDANSFPSLVSNTVYVDIANVYCKNLNCTGVANAPVFNSNGATINVYGSLTLSSGMTVNCNFTMLAASGVQTVTTANCSIPLLSFNGTAIYSLTDNFNGSEIAMNDGTLNTNNHTLNIITRILTNGGTLNAGNTLINCTGYWQQSFSLIPLVLNTSNVRIVFNSSGTIFNFGGSLLTLQLDSVTIVTGLSNSACFVNLQCNYFNCSTPINLSSGNPTAVPYQIHKAVFQDNVIFSKNCSVDSVLFNNPGHSVTIVDTLFINNEWLTNSQPGFPISLNNGVITKSSGQVCVDYYLIQNSVATGGAQFFAGSNSSDLGGNSGWSFISCAPNYSFVWPGDANFDLVANNIDVLYLGLAYGETGTTRPGANLSWTPQPSQTWLTQFMNGANVNNADCDGNGIVNNNDTTAISLNYGLTHPPRLANPFSNNLVSPQLYFIANPDTAMEGDTIEVDMYLGTSSLPVDSIYGIAFTMNFDTSLVDTSYMPFDFIGNWMGTMGVDFLTYVHPLFSQGKVDMALTRTDHNNVNNGFGYLGKAGIVIVDNVGARQTSSPSYVVLPLSISNVTALTASEFELTISSMGTDVEVDTTGTTGLLQPSREYANRINIFPNPAKERLFITSQENINSIEMYDMMNEKVLSQIINNKTAVVTTQKMRKGIYTAKIYTDKGFVNRKIVVMK